MQTKTIRRLVAVSFAVIAVAAVTAGSFAPSARQAAQPAIVGVATGEYADGVAVYRLPSVNVTVSRSAELARIAREDALAMTGQAGHVAAAK